MSGDVVDILAPGERRNVGLRGTTIADCVKLLLAFTRRSANVRQVMDTSWPQ
jgi:hypothetical protein